MMSRMRECQRIRTRVLRAENQQTETGAALMEQETIEENELWRLYQEKQEMYSNSIDGEEDKTFMIL